jgi:hypothetical protein
VMVLNAETATALGLTTRGRCIARRRGDRVDGGMSAIGPKQTFAERTAHVRFWV